MAKSHLNEKLYGLLDSRGYKPDMYDSSGKKVAVPEEAELMQFSFVKDGEDYGKATVTVDGSHRLIVYYNDKIAQSPKAGSQDSQSWEQLMKQLRKFAINYQLGFQRKDVDDLESDMAVRAYNKREGLAEGYHPMGRKQSYNDVIPETKIIIKHSKQMEEGEQRFRNVEKIFIETAQGERFLAPTNRPGIAQIYARHVAEGGRPSDERWNHINQMCEEYSKMAGFVRATKGKQFNESTEKLVNEGLNHYSKLRECLSKMRGKKGYHTYFESWTPTLQEDEVTEDLTDMFKSSSLDPRIESVMPILSKLNKNIAETKLSEVHELEEWADSMLTFETKDEDYQDPIEADYDDDYQEMVKRVGKKAKEQEKAKQQPKQTDESIGSEQKEVGQLGPVGAPAKKGDLVGASESVDPAIARMRKLSGM